MTPQELLAIVAVIAVTRVVLSLRPVVAGSNGRSTALAREFLDPFIIAGLAAWVLITFVARTYYIPSGSMLPTLQIHDVLLVDKFEYRFHPPHRRRHRRLSAAGSDARRLHQARRRASGRPLERCRRPSLRQRRGALEPYVAERPDYALQIRDYGIYVREGGGWEKLDSEHRERSAALDVDGAGSHSAALLRDVRR